MINTARGGLIDETELAEVLISGQLAAAALDVFEQEPYHGPLLKCETAILTSHIGSLAKEVTSANGGGSRGESASGAD